MLRLALIFQIVVAFAPLIAEIDGNAALEQQADAAQEEAEFGDSEEVTDTAITFSCCAPGLFAQLQFVPCSVQNSLLNSQFKDEIVTPPPLN